MLPRGVGEDGERGGQKVRAGGSFPWRGDAMAGTKRTGERPSPLDRESEGRGTKGWACFFFLLGEYNVMNSGARASATL